MSELANHPQPPVLPQGSAASAVVTWLLAPLVMLLLAPVTVQAQTLVRAVEPPQRFDGGPLLVQFRSGGLLESPQRALGVFTGDGEPVPFRLLAHEAEGITSIAIDMPQNASNVRVHYGSRPVRNAQRDDELPVSLVMRTYPLRTMPRHAREIERAIANATPYGAAIVDRIHFAHNPFGPDRRFVTEFDGLLRIDESTTLRLFSNHNEMALLTINGETVIESNEPRTGRDFHTLDEQAAEITLDAGTHRLRYLHVTSDEQPHMALGRMEQRRARVLSSRYFVEHPRGTLALPDAEETLDERGTPVVGFDADQREQMAHEDYTFTRYALRPIAPPPDGMRYRWDFGDTTTMPQRDGERFDHIFPDQAALPQGDGGGDARGWRVVLELIDEDRDRSVARAASRLRPVVFEHTQHAGNERLLRRYAEALALPSYERSPAELLAAYYTLLAETEEPALMAPIAEPFVARFGSRRGELPRQIKRTLATHLAGEDPQRAAQLFGELAQAGGDSWQTATAAAEQLDLMIFRLGETDADAIRRAVARVYANRDARERALLWARVGDAHRVAGRYDDAAEAYREAQRRRGREIEPREAAVMQRAYRETAMSYLQQRRYPALREKLLEWEADFPTAKLEGDLILLIARYFEAIGDDARAATEYRTLIEMNPLHPRRPELAYRLGASLSRLGEPDDARQWLEEVVERYPNSAFADDAQRRLR